MKEYVSKLKSGYSSKELADNLDSLKDIQVLVIGDTIIDEYCFTTLKGRAIKDPILSVEYLYTEKYAGGILAIANHISDYVKKIQIITTIGDRKTNLDFIKNNLKGNISLKYFTKENSFTTVKKRYINKSHGDKLFKVEYMNDMPIKEELEEEIINYLIDEIPKYDLVIVGDFGHGFISEKIIRTIENYSNFLAVNVQTNSANMGFNPIDKYKKVDFAVMNLKEMQYTIRDRFGNYRKLIDKFALKTGFKQFLVTLGGDGCIYNDHGNLYYVPSLSLDIKDTVGAGDAIFAIVSLLHFKNINNALIPFYANAIGGVAIQIIGNKESVTKLRINKFIEELFNECECQKNDLLENKDY